MAFLVGGANSAAAADTGLTNSLRFNDDDSSSLQRTFGTNTSERIKTFSLWFKRSTLGAYQSLFDTTVTGNVEGGVEITNEDRIQVSDRDATDGTGDIFLPTSMVFRDPSAWYHLVVAMDTTQGTDTNRVKVYVNGSQVTSFTTVDYYPPQNYDIQAFKSSVANYIGVNVSSAYYDGYISEFYFIDGQQLAPTAFGEFDEDSGIWKPKEYEGSYGDSGFFLEFKETGTNQDSSGIGADTSGEDNHFAVTNLAATDQTTDTPTNNFATFNPLIKSTNTYSEGNTLVSMDSSADSKTTSTIGVSKGKWYMEFLRNDNDNWPVGIAGSTIEGAYIGGASTDSLSFWVGLAGGGAAETQLWINGSEIDDPWNAATWADGDVVALLLNADDEEISLYKNNSIVGSAYDYSGLNWSQVFFALGNYISGNTYKTNFGNPSFTISSGNADANGYGNFEHAPPNGYYALCTKNLAEYG